MTPFDLIALDLDGTFLVSRFEFHPGLLAAVREARSAGSRLVIATGRIHRGVRPVLAALDLDTPLISSNGARIHDGGRLVYDRPLDAATVPLILEAVDRRADSVLHAYVGDELWVASDNPATREYAANQELDYRVVGPLAAALQGATPVKLLLLAEPARLDELERLLHAAVPAGSLRTTRSWRTFLEILHPEVNKGAALERVSARLGIDRSRVIAAGDQLNDLEMLLWAGTGVAVETASDELRRLAPRVATREELARMIAPA